MRIKISAESDIETALVHRLLRYALAGVGAEIAEAQFEVQDTNDSLGTVLTRCRARVLLCNGDWLRQEEIQSSSDLAVTRALERLARTIQRRVGGERRLASL